MPAARGQAPRYLPLLAGDSPDATKEFIFSAGRSIEKGGGARARARELEPRAVHTARKGGSDGGEDKWRGGRRGATTRREGRRRRGRTAGGRQSKTELEVDDRAIAVVLNVPLEFVREVARASAVAEAAHVEGSAVARHGVDGKSRC